MELLTEAIISDFPDTDANSIRNLCFCAKNLLNEFQEKTVHHLICNPPADGEFHVKIFAIFDNDQICKYQPLIPIHLRQISGWTFYLLDEKQQGRNKKLEAFAIHITNKNDNSFYKSIIIGRK